MRTTDIAVLSLFLFRRGYHPLWQSIPNSLEQAQNTTMGAKTTRRPDLERPVTIWAWGLGASFAITDPIAVAFFSLLLMILEGVLESSCRCWGWENIYALLKFRE